MSTDDNRITDVLISVKSNRVLDLRDEFEERLDTFISYKEDVAKVGDVDYCIVTAGKCTEEQLQNVADMLKAHSAIESFSIGATVYYAEESFAISSED